MQNTRGCGWDILCPTPLPLCQPHLHPEVTPLRRTSNTNSRTSPWRLQMEKLNDLVPLNTLYYYPEGYWAPVDLLDRVSHRCIPPMPWGTAGRRAAEVRGREETPGPFPSRHRLRALRAPPFPSSGKAAGRSRAGMAPVAEPREGRLHALFTCGRDRPPPPPPPPSFYLKGRRCSSCRACERRRWLRRGPTDPCKVSGRAPPAQEQLKRGAQAGLATGGTQRSSLPPSSPSSSSSSSGGSPSALRGAARRSRAPPEGGGGRPGALGSPRPWRCAPWGGGRPKAAVGRGRLPLTAPPRPRALLRRFPSPGGRKASGTTCGN